MKIPLTALIDRFFRGCMSDYRKTFTNMYSSEYCRSAFSKRSTALAIVSAGVNSLTAAG